MEKRMRQIQRTISRGLILVCAASVVGCGDAGWNSPFSARSFFKNPFARQNNPASNLAPTSDAAYPAPPAVVSSLPDEQPGKVGRSLRGMRTINTKPDQDAKYYVYMQAPDPNDASSRDMKKAVRDYKKMKAAGMEVIYVAPDHSEKETKSYLKKNHAKFSGITEKQAKKLPGYPRNSNSSRATYVDADGKVLRKSRNSSISDWKSVVDHAKH